MTTKDILALARKHLSKDTSDNARVCYDQALAIFDALPSSITATRCALKSLAYSVGILHADFKSTGYSHWNDPLAISRVWYYETLWTDTTLTHDFLRIV